MLALLLFRGGGTATVVVVVPRDLGGVGGSSGGGEASKRGAQKFKPTGDISYVSIDTGKTTHRKRKGAGSGPDITIVTDEDIPIEVLLQILKMLD
jgi:hypothetical protein